jgi:hypothetical protein
MKVRGLIKILSLLVVISFAFTYWEKKTYFLDEIISIRAAQNQQEKDFVDSVENRWVNFANLNRLIFEEEHSLKEIAKDVYSNYVFATDFPHTNLYHSLLRVFMGLFNFQGVNNYFFGLFLFQLMILFFLAKGIIKLVKLSLGSSFEIVRNENFEINKSHFQFSLILVIYSIFFGSSDVISSFLLNRQYWLTLLVSLVHFNFVYSNYDKLTHIRDYKKHLFVWVAFLFWSSTLIITIYGAILWCLGLIAILVIRDVVNNRHRIDVLVKTILMWVIFFAFLTVIVFCLFPAYNLFNGRVNEALTNLFSFDKLYFKLYRIKHLLIFYGNPYILSFFPIVVYLFVRDVFFRKILDLRYFMYSSAILFFTISCFNLFVAPISTLRYAYPPLQLLYLILIIIAFRVVIRLVQNKFLLYSTLFLVFLVNLYVILSVNISEKDYVKDRIEYTEINKLDSYKAMFEKLNFEKRVMVKVELKNDFEIMHLMGLDFENVQLYFTRRGSDKKVTHNLLLTSFSDKDLNKERYDYLGKVNCFHAYRLVSK